MALDLIARAAASSAQSAATGALAAAAPADLFVNLGSKAIDAAVKRIVSTGYSAIGAGAGTYVSDSLASAALAAAHPRFCSASANGRYFRLIPDAAEGAITVAQGGATGDGSTNDQPAINAALAYAVAAGIPEVRFTARSYVVHCPARVSMTGGLGEMGFGGINPTGTPLAINAALATAPFSIKLSGLPGCGTTIIYKGFTGGNPDSDYQTVDDNPWRGGGLHLYGDQYPYPANLDDYKLQCFEMENIRLAGGRSAGSKTPNSTDYSDKGLFTHNAIRRIVLKNCEIDHFGHELLYGGNYLAPSMEVWLENVKAHASNHSVLNFQMAKRIVDFGGQYGDAYIAAELYGANYDFIGTRFFDSAQLNFSSSVTTAIPSGENFAFPAYGSEMAKTRLIGVEMQNVDAAALGSHIFGDLTVIDGRVELQDYAGDIDLDLTTITDQAGSLTPLIFNGPSALPTGNATGFLPRNINVRLKAKRSRKARDAGRTLGCVYAFGGYLDPETVCLTIDHAARANAWGGAYGTQVAMPKVVVGAQEALAHYGTMAPGEEAGGITGTYTLAPQKCGMTVYLNGNTAMSFGAVGTYGNAYEGIANGQRFRFVHAAGAYKASFAKAGANMALTRDRATFAPGDWLDFEYNRVLGKWVDVGGYVSDTLRGSATYDAPSVAAGGTTTTTVTVTGAALGDAVSAVTFGVSLQGMVASAYVSAANTVTVVLQNPTGAAVDLASTSVTVTVTRA